MLMLFHVSIKMYDPGGSSVDKNRINKKARSPEKMSGLLIFF